VYQFINEIKEYADSVSDEKKGNYTVYFHNMGSFDGIFILQMFAKQGITNIEIIKRGSEIFQIK
jgi:hypothetical protein